MAKSKVTVRLDIQEELKKLKDQKTLKELGDVVVEESKKMIAKGISPVDGVGRFDGYKAQKGKGKKGYPYNVMDKYPDKKVRPVNLYLSGETLKEFVHKVNGKRLEVGWFGKTKQTEIAGHLQRGTDSTPARPILPLENGSRFNSTITRAIQTFLNKKIVEILKRSNSKK
jgi:hypothetical protein